jgi:hypothetical protein
MASVESVNPRSWRSLRSSSPRVMSPLMERGTLRKTVKIQMILALVMLMSPPPTGLNRPILGPRVGTKRPILSSPLPQM